MLKLKQILYGILIFGSLLPCSVARSQHLDKVNILSGNISLKALIQEIENQTDYAFVFDNSIPLSSLVNLEGREKDVTVLLKQAFGSKGIAYEIVGKQIILKKEQPKKEQSQSGKQVTGVVKDEQGQAIIGANVKVKNSDIGTITGMDGKFILQVPVNAELEISYVGYVTRTVKVGDAQNLQITIAEDAQALGEVVVVGYGTQKKVNLTGAVASISSEEIKERVQPNVLSAVQGIVPGITVISRPGQTPSINFRGRGNLGTSEPLYVIDGAIADASFFSNLDPNSIESISFLKDAASSSIYGSRAAYGVVLVTTKQGKKQKMNVSYNGYVGIKMPTYVSEVLDSWDYATLLNEAKYNVDPSKGEFQAYSAEEIGWFMDGSKPDLYPNSKWADMILDKKVATTQHSLNFSGGSDKIRYFLGLGYMFDDKFMPGQTSDRYNLNTNIASDMTNWLTLKAGIKYIRTSSETEHGTPWMGHFLMVPSIMVGQQSNGQWGSMAGGKQATQTFIQNNPLRALNKSNWSNNKVDNTIIDLGFDLKPIKGLTISGQGVFKGYEYKSKSYISLQDNVCTFNNGKIGNEIPGTGVYTNSMDMNWISNNRLLYTTTAKYDWSNSVHNVGVLVGISYEYYKYERLYSKRKDFVTDIFQDIEAGAIATKDLPNGVGLAENKMLSYFGRIDYSFMGRYLLEANIRTDASSRFHKNNRWGVFPSFSAGWRMSEETFIKNIQWVNNLKIRASYGTLGNINNVGNYDYFESYSNGANYNFNDNPVKGILESRPANKILGWETVALTDFGLDLDLFHNKLSVTADYYIKNTSDILLQYKVPAETGITNSPSLNLAKVRNSGFELTLTHRNKIGQVSYSVSGNIATNHNKIINLAGSNNIEQNGGDKIRFILREGESVGSFYGYKTNGLYTQEEIVQKCYYKFGRAPKAGDIKYVSSREEIKYICDLKPGESEALASINGDDRTIIGKDVPDFTYGLNLSIQWKNFELSLFGQGVSGTMAAFESEQVSAFILNSNPRKFHLKRWNQDNPNPRAVYPRIYGGTSMDNYNQHFSDYQLFDADYFRIKTISLGYMIPTDKVTNWGFSGLKFFLTAENLFTIRADKEMEDFDPESASGRGLGALGTKSVAFGVNVTF